MSLNKRLVGTGAGASLSLSIGDFVGGGVVFYVDPNDDTQGLVVAPTRFYGARFWTSNPGYGNVTTSAIGRGYENSVKAISYTGWNFAVGQSVQYTGGGFRDWFMPTKDEQQKMFDNYEAVNASLTANGANYTIGVNDYTRCSSVKTSNATWGGTVTNGMGGNAGTYNNDLYHYAVRAVNQWTREETAGMINYALYQGSVNGGRTLLQIYVELNGEWILVDSGSTSPSSQGSTYIPFYSYGKVPKNTPVKIYAEVGFFYSGDDYAARVYDTYLPTHYATAYRSTLQNVVLSTEGNSVFTDYGTYYEYRKYSSNFAGFTAVMYFNI